MNNRNYRTRARVPVNYQNTEPEWYTFLTFE